MSRLEAEHREVGGSRSPIRRILVPVDFSECSKKALSHALAWASVLGAEVEVLHVVAPPPYVPLDLMILNDATAQTMAAADEELGRFVSSLTTAAVPKRVESGIPFDAILTAAEDHDLVVMGTHGRAGLSHLMMGSVAERVLRGAACPVLTVPPDRPAKSSG